MAKEPVEIEIHEQKEGMTGVFVIREPKGPKGKPDPCSYRPCYLDEEKAKAELIQSLQKQLLEMNIKIELLMKSQSGQTS